MQFLIVGDIDSTFYAKNQSCYIPFEFTNVDDPSTGDKIINMYGTQDSCFSGGEYKLTDGNDNLTLNMDHNNYIPIGPYRASERITWSINNLSGSQLWLETNYKGMHCWMHLKKT